MNINGLSEVNQLLLLGLNFYFSKMHFYLHYYNIARHNRADPLPNRIDTSFYIVLPGSVRTMGIKQQPASLDSFCRNETGSFI
jgi:hypothetical protein